MGLFDKLLGKDRQEAWKTLSEEMGALYVDRGLLKGGPMVILNYKNWEITLDVYTESSGGENRTSTTYTRIAVPFVKSSDFTLTVYPERTVQKLTKRLGSQDIIIGIPEIDDMFMIKSNDSQKAKYVVMNEKFQYLLQGMGNARLGIQDSKGLFTRKENVVFSEIIYQHVGVISDMEMIKSMFSLVEVSLDLMVEIGKASGESVKKIAYGTK